MGRAMLARVLAIICLLTLTACAGAITTGPDGNSPHMIHLRAAALKLDSRSGPLSPAETSLEETSQRYLTVSPAWQPASPFPSVSRSPSPSPSPQASPSPRPSPSAPPMPLLPRRPRLSAAPQGSPSPSSMPAESPMSTLLASPNRSPSPNPNPSVSSPSSPSPGSATLAGHVASPAPLAPPASPPASLSISISAPLSLSPQGSPSFSPSPSASPMPSPFHSPSHTPSPSPSSSLIPSPTSAILAGNITMPTVSLPATMSQLIPQTAPPSWTKLDIPEATNRTSITGTFAAVDSKGAAVQTFHCRLRAISVYQGSGTSAGQWEPCSSPMTFTGLQEGQWGVTILAIDAAGAVNEAAEKSFWVAFTAPTASISSGPAMGATVTSNSVTYELAAIASPTATPIATYETMLVMVSQSQFARVAGAKSTDSRAARATPAEVGDTELLPRAMRTLLSADGYVTPSITGSNVSAASVLGSWVSSTGSISYKDLGDGYYVFQVYAVDIAGNVGPITASPFQVAAGSAGIGTSVIIGAAVGGSGGLLLVVGCFIWWARRRSQANSRLPITATPLLDPCTSEAADYTQPCFAAQAHHNHSE